MVYANSCHKVMRGRILCTKTFVRIETAVDVDTGETQHRWASARKDALQPLGLAC